VLRADPVELAVLVQCARSAVEHQQQRDLALARTIVRELANALKRR
jgi:hypothetical protein